MSFFYIELLFFILLGIISSYRTEEKLQKIKSMQIIFTIIIVGFLIINTYGNITLKIAKEFVSEKNKIYNFDIANKLAPYSLEVKKGELEYIEPSHRNIQRQIEIYNEIIKIEKGYDRIYAYDKISKSALFQLKKGRIQEAEETLKQAMNILEKRENRFKIQISTYYKDISTIYYNIEEIKEWNENIVVEQYIKECAKHIINIIDECEHNITNYKVTRQSKEYYEEIMQRMQECKQSIIQMEMKNWNKN